MLISGSTVFVRIASTARAPLSTSVQRLRMRSITFSSYVNGTFCCSWMRLPIQKLIVCSYVAAYFSLGSARKLAFRGTREMAAN